eukprot:1156422-Pelagomonas_calceolata.AAC.4
MPTVPSQSNANLTLKVANWRTWAYTDGSCQAHNGKQEMGQASTARSLTAKTLLNPTVLGLLTPYVVLNWQQQLLLSPTAMQTLRQIASPLSIKYVNSFSILRNT